MRMGMRNARKTGRTLKKHTVNHNTGYSLTDMFERFMFYKKTEGSAPRTLSDYQDHFRYLIQFTNGDISHDEITIDLIREYIAYMLHDRGLSNVTVNVRIRTLRAFLHFCYDEGYISEAIHSKIKLLRTDEDTIQSLTINEIKSILSKIDTNTYVGFRDYVVICTLLDTMVRISELCKMKRSNVNLKEGLIKLEAHETKTRRSRIVPLSSKTVRLVYEYMKETDFVGEELLFL